MQVAVTRHVTLPRWAKRLFKITRPAVAALPAQCVSPLRFALARPLEKALGKRSGRYPSYKLPCNSREED